MHYGLYINGKWTKSSSGKYFDSINPATEKIIGKFAVGNEKDVKKAVDAAEDAFQKWSEMPLPKRAKIILDASRILEKEKERLARLVAMEMGKILPEARGDVQEAIDISEYMHGEGRRFFGHTTTSELKNKFAMTIRRPVGIAGIITPWNFPIAIPSWKITAALISGNTIVFKPSSDTPLCAVEFVKIFEKAGLPKGVLNMVTGPGDSVGKEIITNKKITAISFTGNRETGEWITKNTGIKKIGLELGGKNGVIIMDDADLKLALDGTIWGAFGTTGQRCTATSRVLVHKAIKEKFVRELCILANSLKVGNALHKGTQMGPLINRQAMEKCEKYVSIGKSEGARLLCGGSRLQGKGFFFPPTIFEASAGMRISQEEIFGPIISVIEISSLEEGIEKMNAIDYGLSSAIYTRNVNNAFRAIEKIQAGLTYVNTSTIGSEVHLPFGGIKGTGSGREGGILGIDEFTETKTVYVDYSGKLQKAQIDD